jgi:predicted small lipoprotein YifL
MRPLLSVIALAVALAGCGYKTPLTLPKPKPVEKPAAQKPAPAETGEKPKNEP